MNTTITEVADSTSCNRARVFAEQLINQKAKRLRVTFTKKNGERRVMITVPQNAWNQLNGIETTAVGRRIVESKVANDIVNVVEMLPGGKIQPRSIPLRRVINVERA